MLRISSDGDGGEGGEVCELAGVRGRPREVLVLIASGVSSEEIAERLGIALGSVHVYAHRGRAKIVAAQEKWDELEFHRFVLREGMVGPAVSNPATPLFRVTGPGYGERVRLHPKFVTEDDLVVRVSQAD